MFCMGENHVKKMGQLEKKCQTKWEHITMWKTRKGIAFQHAMM